VSATEKRNISGLDMNNKTKPANGKDIGERRREKGRIRERQRRASK